jgi:hypothetical protein
VQVEEAQRPYLCMDLSFLHTLLTQGFKVQQQPDSMMQLTGAYSGPSQLLSPISQTAW